MRRAPGGTANSFERVGSEQAPAPAPARKRVPRSKPGFSPRRALVHVKNGVASAFEGLGGAIRKHPLAVSGGAALCGALLYFAPASWSYVLIGATVLAGLRIAAATYRSIRAGWNGDYRGAERGFGDVAEAVTGLAIKSMHPVAEIAQVTVHATHEILAEEPEKPRRRK